MAPGNWCDPPKIQNQNKKRDDKNNSDDPLADLPQWLEEFKENLVDRIACIRTNSSQESDPEHPTKVATKSRKHCIYTHFPKDWNCDVCLRTEMTRVCCRNSLAKLYLVQKSLVT